MGHFSAFCLTVQSLLGTDRRAKSTPWLETASRYDLSLYSGVSQKQDKFGTTHPFKSRFCQLVSVCSVQVPLSFGNENNNTSLTGSL